MNQVGSFEKTRLDFVFEQIWKEIQIEDLDEVELFENLDENFWANLDEN